MISSMRRNPLFGKKKQKKKPVTVDGSFEE